MSIALPAGLTAETRTLSGWGRTNPVTAQVVQPGSVEQLQAIAPFFHPLDGVQDWNRIYGPAGFLQYQFAVPNAAAHLVPRTLEALRQVGAPSFLTVLKRFGPSNPAPLSFPIPGWTLAADVPAAGGRLYLAKDSRQSATMFAKSDSTLQEWSRHSSSLDPEDKILSAMKSRLMP